MTEVPDGGLAARLITDLHGLADAADGSARARYFGATPGGYAEGDQHLGVRVPALRVLARSSWRDATGADLDLLVTSELHEARLLAVLIAGEQFKRADDSGAARLVAWVLDSAEHLDNWDLVDSVAPSVVGEWVLADLARLDVLDLLQSSANPWSRRLALVATHTLIRGGVYDPTLGLARQAVSDPSRWVHKAAGWMLRDVGQRDRVVLDEFLAQHAATMPRDMLRTAVEKHDPEQRRWYLAARGGAES